LTYSLEVEPLQPGYWPTNVEATGEFVDSQQRRSSFTFDVPWVTVLRAVPIPTPILSPAPPAPTPTTTPTPLPTNTHTPRPEPIYLPKNLAA
jgi:hypothetical protein